MAFPQMDPVLFLEGMVRVLDMDNENLLDEARDAMQAMIDLCGDNRGSVMVDMNKVAVLLMLVKERLDAVTITANVVEFIP